MEAAYYPNGSRRRRLTRRAFLRAGSNLATGLILAACVAPREQLTVGEMARPLELSNLPGPAPVTPVAVSEVPALAQFLTLSTVLTGYDNLDPALGKVYLDSIDQSGDFEMTVDELAQAVGLPSDAPPTTADLEAAGLFDDPAARSLADAILNMWYTGIYTTADGEQAVATYVGALVWRAITFTKPLTVCGSPGFWAQPPQQAFA